MTNEELREARETLRLSPAEAADLLEVDVSSVYRWERDPAKKTYRAAPARVARLYAAYLAGYRPDDWPERLEGIEDRIAEINEVRT
jgi:transcriptional regulator with XRE-family HTH domain